MEASEQSMDQRSLRIAGELIAWSAAWAASLALAKFGPGLVSDGNDTVVWTAIAVNVAVGIGWMLAHARFLRRVDELQRKIVLDAMAVALGAGVVGGSAYAVANGAGVLAIDSPIAKLSVLMAVIYILGVFVGNLRYR